jgi:sulfur carrier protein ThiS
VRVLVEIGGVLRKPSGQARFVLELPDPCSAAELIPQLGYSEREQRAVRLSRDGEVLVPTTPLHDGDHVVVFTAVGGG